MRPWASLVSAVVAAALLPTLVSCSSSDNPEGGGGTPSTPTASPASAADSPTESPTSSPTSSSPSAATGDSITVSGDGQDFLTLRTPDQQWDIASEDSATLSKAGSVSEIYGKTLLKLPDNTLDDYAEASLGSDPSARPRLSRLENRTVAGVECWVLEGHGPGIEYEIGAVYEDTIVIVSFEFPRNDAQAAASIEAVLASAEWL